jgi:hypothetical protein
MVTEGDDGTEEEGEVGNTKATPEACILGCPTLASHQVDGGRADGIQAVFSSGYVALSAP